LNSILFMEEESKLPY